MRFYNYLSFAIVSSVNIEALFGQTSANSSIAVDNGPTTDAGEELFINKKYGTDELSAFGNIQSTLTLYCPFLRSNVAIPIYNHSQAVNISIEYEFVSFLGTDDVTETLSHYASFHISWRLPACAKWDMTDMDQPAFLWLAIDNLWRPSLFVENSRARENPFKKYTSDVMLFFNGDALFDVKTIFETSCDFDFQKFPFDEQVCEIQLSINNAAQTRQAWIKMSVDENGFSKSVWMLKNKSFEVTESMRQVNFKFTLKRRAESYAGNLFAPTTLLAIQQLVSLLMPPETPDRPALSVSILISISVYQSALAKELPQTSQVLNIMIYYNAQLAIAIGITVYSLTTCRLLNNREKRHSMRQLICFKLIRKIDLIEVIAAFAFIALYFAVNVIFFGNVDFY